MNEWIMSFCLMIIFLCGSVAWRRECVAAAEEKEASMTIGGVTRQDKKIFVIF
jgi:hypothetical protein